MGQLVCIIVIRKHKSKFNLGFFGDGGIWSQPFFVYHSWFFENKIIKDKKTEEIKREQGGFAYLKTLKILKTYKNSDPIFENYGSISFFKDAPPKEKETKKLQPQKKKARNQISSISSAESSCMVGFIIAFCSVLLFERVEEINLKMPRI